MEDQDMFASLSTIQDIGNFQKQGYIKLAPVTLIHGFNGHGKSTLADIFRSLSFNDSQIIRNRKRISPGPQANPAVELSFIDDFNKEKKLIFNNNWNEKIFPYEIEIFDSRFVEENVFTGSVPQRLNKVNMTTLILGRENVRLGKEIEFLQKQKKEKKKKITDIVTRIKRNIGENVNINRLLQLPKPEDQKTLEKTVCQLWEEKERLKMMADKADKIRELEEPLDLPLSDVKIPSLKDIQEDVISDTYTPHVRISNARIPSLKGDMISDTHPSQEGIFNLLTFTDLIRETINLLSQDFDAVTREALSELELHMEKNLKTRDGEENIWIEKGLSYIRIPDTGTIENSCPFCGQSLDNVKKIIKTYQSFFGKAYKDYSMKISKTLASKNAFLINAIGKFDDLRNNAQQNLNRLNRFKEYSDHTYTARLEIFDHLTTELLESASLLKRSLAEAQAKLAGHITEKLKIPFVPINVTDLNTQEISLLSDKTNRLTEKYRQMLKEMSAMISELKSKANNPKLPEEINKISLKLSDLEIKSKRCEFDAEISEIKRSEHELDMITAEIQSKQQEMEKKHLRFTNHFFSYVENIYNYINPESDFKIKSLLDSRGYQPVYYFQIFLRDKSVAEKSFSHVLSDGDRRTLALSVFLGNLKSRKESGTLGNSIIILDDPVISMDEHRISYVILFIRSLMKMCRQVIVLSYYKEFLENLYNSFQNRNNVLILNIQKQGHQSVLTEIKDSGNQESHDIQDRSSLTQSQTNVQKKYESRPEHIKTQDYNCTKQIVCLANSRKYSGYCVAGKELLKKQTGNQTGNQIGNWIRPVSTRETGELSIKEIVYKNRKLPKLLDIITVTLTKHSPHSCQTENYAIDETRSWTKKGELPVSDTPKLCDDADILWTNGYDSRNGLNDRVPQEITENNLSSSLLFVKPKNVCIIVIQESYDKRIRAKFDFNNIRYCLAVTDPVAESKYLRKDPGEYPLVTNDLYFCVSIGEPFEGYCYKLVAGIVGLKIED